MVGENGFQYVSAATYYNGDLIFEAINSDSNERYFYGLTKSEKLLLKIIN